MDAVEVSEVIARPREEVFAYLADVANHSEFMDHFTATGTCMGEESYGRGAGARFKVDIRPGKRFPGAT